MEWLKKKTVRTSPGQTHVLTRNWQKGSHPLYRFCPPSLHKHVLKDKKADIPRAVKRISKNYILAGRALNLNRPMENTVFLIKALVMPAMTERQTSDRSRAP